jgi:hypothetical protein
MRSQCLNDLADQLSVEDGVPPGLSVQLSARALSGIEFSGAGIDSGNQQTAARIGSEDRLPLWCAR